MDRRAAERRVAPRIPVLVRPAVTLRRARGRWVAVEGDTVVVDLSADGLRVEAQSEMRVGDRLELVFPSADGGEGTRLAGRVVRVQRRGPGEAGQSAWQAGCRLGRVPRGRSTRRVGSRAEAERLEGVKLAGRTAQHELNNALALVVGYAELLAGDERLPEDARQMALEARRGAYEAAEIVSRLARVRRLVEVTFGGRDWPVLDLERSSGPDAATDAPASG